VSGMRGAGWGASEARLADTAAGSHFQFGFNVVAILACFN